MNRKRQMERRQDGVGNAHGEKLADRKVGSRRARPWMQLSRRARASLTMTKNGEKRYIFDLTNTIID
jgi:hypothetical protein